MRITIKTDQYNERRHGRPWVAVVASWETGQRPALRWGSWIGRDGCSGMLEIEAEPGDILRWGQKDQRQPQSSANNWGIVLHTGEIRDTHDTDAREYYLRIRAKGYYHTEIERQEAAIAAHADDPDDKIVKFVGRLPGLERGEHTRGALNAARRAWIEEVRQASTQERTA